MGFIRALTAFGLLEREGGSKASAAAHAFMSGVIGLKG